MSPLVSVAIPVRNAGPGLADVLIAVGAQRIHREIEVVICDSGSTDGSVALARRRGAHVIEIRPEEFSHGATRNLIMERSQGEHVAFLTQDSVPAGPDWLEALLAGFALAPDVALVYGPYRPRPDASVMVARELTSWFDGFAPDGRPRVDRVAAGERALGAGSLLGPRGFFTDANGAVARAAWAQVPFRPIAYAEDHALAHDMLRAGFAKAFVPDAAVVHSHEYSTWGWLQRSFDEGRALADLYGWRQPINPRTAARTLRGRVGADWQWAAARAAAPAGWAPSLSLLARATVHHGARLAGTALGGRADRLPAEVVRRLSHERRAR